MIKITLYHFKDGALKGFLIKGHSGSAESGRDIICSAVSSAAYLTANTLTEIAGVTAEADVGDGFMKFVIADDFKEQSQIVLKGFELHLKQLEEQYHEYVKITTEV